MNYESLISNIAEIHQQAQAGAAGAVNRHLIIRNWLIGAYLVEFEQYGEDRARYGVGLLKRLSVDLRQRNVPGTSPDLLERMRLFYQTYPQFVSQISATVSRKLLLSLSDRGFDISASASRKSSTDGPTPLSPQSLGHYSWSHFVEFIRLDDPWKRAFYEIECLKSNWSVRQLQRQIGSLLYERTGLSTDKQAVIDARQQAADAPCQIADLIRGFFCALRNGAETYPARRSKESHPEFRATYLADAHSC